MLYRSAKRRMLQWHLQTEAHLAKRERIKIARAMVRVATNAAPPCSRFDDCVPAGWLVFPASFTCPSRSNIIARSFHSRHLLRLVGSPSRPLEATVDLGARNFPGLNKTGRQFRPSPSRPKKNGRPGQKIFLLRLNFRRFLFLSLVCPVPAVACSFEEILKRICLLSLRHAAFFHASSPIYLPSLSTNNPPSPPPLPSFSF